MVKAATLEVEIGAKIDQFERSLGKVRKDLGGMEKRLGGVSRGANKASTAFSGMAKRLIAIGLAYFGARGIFRMAKSFLDVATSVETYKLRLDAMLGSQEAATDAMNFFKEVAAKVPFTLEEVIEAGVKVQAFGADLKAWTPIMADLAAFMGVKLPEAASALGRAYAGGAGAADIFRERGILQVIKDFAKMERGIDDITKISLPEFRDVMFEAFAGAESKVAGTADKLATTWIGIVSMLQDKWFKFRDAVMKTKIFELMKENLAAFNEKLDAFVEAGKMDKWAKDMAIGILETFKSIILGIEGLIIGFYALKASVTAISQRITELLIQWSEFVLGVTEITKHLGGAFKKEHEDLIARIESLKDKQKDLNKEYDIQIENIRDTYEKYDPLIKKLKEYEEEIKNIKIETKALTEKTEKFGEKLVETTIPAVGKTIEILRAAGVMTKDWVFALEGLSERGMLMAEEMTYAFAGGIMNVLDAFHRLGEEGGSVLDTLGEAMRGFVSVAINALKRFVTDILTSAATTVLAKQAEAIAGVIASVMKSVGFPLNLLLVGGAIATVSALFAGLKPKKFETGGYVPTETFAHLHAGERVLSAADVRRGVGAGAGGGINLTVAPIYNIMAMDALGVRDFMRTRGIAEIVDAVKAGVLKPEFREALGVKT